MDELRQATAEAPGPVPRSHPPGAEPEPPPGVVDAARRLIDEGGDAAHSGLAMLRALKDLAGAELALAKQALVRAAVMAIGAALTALVAVIYVFATLSAWLASLGLGLPLALAISTVLLLALVGLLAWRAVALTRLARFDGTRRQLARLREGTP